MACAAKTDAEICEERWDAAGLYTLVQESWRPARGGLPAIQARAAHRAARSRICVWDARVKEVVARQAIELSLLNTKMLADGGDEELRYQHREAGDHPALEGPPAGFGAPMEKSGIRVPPFIPKKIFYISWYELYCLHRA